MRHITITVPEENVAGMVWSLKLIHHVVCEFKKAVDFEPEALAYEAMDIINNLIDMLELPAAPGEQTRE